MRRIYDEEDEDAWQEEPVRPARVRNAQSRSAQRYPDYDDDRYRRPPVRQRRPDRYPEQQPARRQPARQLLRLYDNAVRQYQHNDLQPEPFRLPELPDPPPDQAILETQQPPHSLLYWLLMGAFLAIVVGTFSLPI
jgi:hypothetical protein